MIGGVTRHMLPHLPGVPNLHENRPYYFISTISIRKQKSFISKESQPQPHIYSEARLLSP